MKIDLHAHYVPRDCFDMIAENGKRYGPTIVTDPSGQELLVAGGLNLGPVARATYDPETRLKDMDRIGLDMQAVSLSPTSFFYDLDAGLGLKFCQKHNNGIAQLVNAHPDRFVGLATLPMQNVGLAVAEMERAVKELGFKGVEISTSIYGKNLDQPEFLPLYQKAHALDIPIFIHPYYNAGIDRLQKYFLVNLVGNPFDNSIAIASIIFGGILQKFPRLKFKVAHAGGAVPYIRGRMEHGYNNVPESHSAIPRPPSEYLKLMYFDTVIHYQPALSYMLSTQGADHVVLGSDYPFVMGDLDPISTVRGLPRLSQKDRDKILWDNAAALLKL